MDKTLCIYHDKCADGFMAATVVLDAMGERHVEFVPGRYGEAPPDVKGRDVMMVDFSYKRPVLLEMAAQARSILILDHHKSAAADLVDLPRNVTAVFDMNRSGAMMAWDYCNPNGPPPLIVQHVQDRDLWRFDMEGTEDIQAALFSYPYHFPTWLKFLRNDMLVNDLEKEGRTLARKHRKDVSELLPYADELSILGYRVPMLNCPFMFASAAGNELAAGQAFAACYQYGADGVSFSLRSKPNTVDVSKVAAVFGGGGHANAAGFKINFCQLLRLADYWLIQEECK